MFWAEWRLVLACEVSSCRPSSFYRSAVADLSGNFLPQLALAPLWHAWRRLSVVLDCHPIFTTIIILAGWLVKTIVASLVSEWVGTGLGLGADKAAGEMWLAYSIP